MADYLAPLQAAYHDISPKFATAPAYAGQGAVVLGRAALGGGAWLGPWSVIRADGHDVTVGDDFHLGEHGTVHIAHDVYPTHIGHRVTAGDGAVIHACNVGDGCVVGPEVVILDGATIGAGAVITAGSVVFPRSDLPGGWLYSGSPAKPVAPVSASELDAYHQKIRSAVRQSAPVTRPLRDDLQCFVAPTAVVTGQVTAGQGSSIWYGCHLDAGAHRIVFGDNTNIQDNSLLVARNGDILIAPDVTIGHNVTMSDCVIDQNSLVGIGAVIASGTHVQSDVLVAAGARTEPGQVLHSGHVWAGNPARPIGAMDDRKRKILLLTLPTYRDYAARFQATPHHPLVPAKTA
jgi:carbonic anhydrase/acetyltransferase-like protein (isoleucine patch superfamily)